MPKSIFDQYVAAKAEVEAAQAAVKAAQVASREILKQVLADHGKGPHDFGGKKCIVVDRKGVLCLMQSMRPKVTKAADKEPKPAKAPKAPKALSKKAAKLAAQEASP